MPASQEFHECTFELYIALSQVASEILDIEDNKVSLLSDPNVPRSVCRFETPLGLRKEGKPVAFVGYSVTIGFDEELNRVVTYRSQLDVASSSGA